MQMMASIIDIIEAIAWPVTVLVAVFGLREVIYKLADRVTSVDVKGVKMELSEKLNAARNFADDAAITRIYSARALSSAIPPAAAPQNTMGSLETAKSTAIDSDQTMWLFSGDTRSETEVKADQNGGLFMGSMFDDVVKDFTNIAARISGEKLSLNASIQLLTSKDVLTKDMVKIYNELQSSRNMAVHADGNVMTPAEMADWAGISLGLRQRADQRSRMLNLVSDETT